MSIAALKAQRAKLLADAKAITAKARSESRELIDAEMATCQDITGKITALDAQIVKAEADAAMLAKLDAEADALAAPVAPSRTSAGAAQPGTPVATSVRDLALDSPSRGFKSPREFFAAVMHAGQSRNRNIDSRLKPLATVGSDENQGGQDTLGGFLIPQAYVSGLLQVANETDPTVGRTTSIPMGSPIVNIPARTDKNHTSSVSGGLTFTRRVETAAATDSKMAFENVSLRANPLTGLNFTTEELLSDSPESVSALIAAGFQQEYAATILKEKLFGTGAGQYLGAFNSANPCLVSQAKETGQAAATIVLNNVLKMRSRCWGYSQAIWIANHDTYPQLAQLQLPVGTGGVALYMPSAAEDRPDTLLGRPIFYSEFAKTLGGVSDIMLGNWSQFIEGTLGSANPEIQESIHVRFTTNERTFKVSVRNDGQPWWKSALTPNQSSTTLSPFVTLAVRA